MINYININDCKEEKEWYDRVSLHSLEVSIVKNMNCRVCGGIVRHVFYSATGYEENRYKYIKLIDDYLDNCHMHPIIQIGKEAFKNHNELVYVYINANINTIGEETFSGCDNLEKIYFPKTLHHIQKNAFNNCKNLKVIYYEGTKEEFQKIEIYKESVKITSTGCGGTFYREAEYFAGNDILYDCTIFYNCSEPSMKDYFTKEVKSFKCEIFIEEKNKTRKKSYKNVAGVIKGNVLAGCLTGYELLYYKNKKMESDFYSIGANIVKVVFYIDKEETIDFTGVDRRQRCTEAMYCIKNHTGGQVDVWKSQLRRRI